MSSEAVKALREWASCIRGDWGDIDGRSVKAEMESIADALEGGERADWDVRQWRNDMGMCPDGGGHWTRHCCTDKTWGCGNEPTNW